MSPERKRQLVAAFLKATFKDQYDVAWLDSMDHFSHIEEAIDFLMDDEFEFLQLDTLDETDPQFRVFMALLGAGVEFSETMPPESTAFNEDTLGECWSIEKPLWNTLPNVNYTARETREIPLDLDEELVELQTEALQVLIDTTLKPIFPDERFENSEDLKKILAKVEKDYQKEKNEERKHYLKNILNLLKNLDKIDKLQVIEIPLEDNPGARFCTLAESAGGVTAKISLIPIDRVKDILTNIIHDSESLSLKQFSRNSSDYELKPQGILKLPKHGKTTEVQREAIALNISRILNFTTTSSTMVSHDGKAALFVPFDRIQLMNEFAKGEEQTLMLPSSFGKISTIGDKYIHYSQIVPVGNQLHGDRILNDFGEVMGYAYLCNDTDFIGAENQNKAIRDGLEFYIFDQVVKSSTKMELDTRFSLVPVTLSRHSRHNQGRNRSIVEDSSFDNKFASVIDLIEHQQKINIMLDNTISMHQSRAMQLNREIERIEPLEEGYSLEQKQQRTALQDQLGEVEKLRVDAIGTKNTINRRMDNLFKNFPSINGERLTVNGFIHNQALVKQSLLLEKLVNHPVLFSEVGRPYRNPWTNRNKNSIQSIIVEDGRVILKFKKLDKKEMAFILRKSGVDLDECLAGKDWIKLPRTELLKINEESLFPEIHPFSMDHHYLDVAELEYLSAGYEKSPLKQAITTVKDYQAKLLHLDDSASVANLMKNVLRSVHTAQKDSKTPGFLKHLEIKLQHDVQQHLRNIIQKMVPDNDIEETLANAYEAAVKLDRVNDINHVLIQFVRYPSKQNQKELIQYLDNCIAHGVLAENYNAAKIESKLMEEESGIAFKQFAKPEKSSVSKIMRVMQDHSDEVHDAPIMLHDWDEDEDEVDVIGNEDRLRVIEREQLLTDMETPPEMLEEPEENEKKGKIPTISIRH